MPPRRSQEDRCIVVSGRNIERSKCVEEFSRFGQIRKIFIDPSNKYAKIYFDHSSLCEQVAAEYKNNNLGWTIDFPSNGHDMRLLEEKLRNDQLDPNTSFANSYSSGTSSNHCSTKEREMDFESDEAECNTISDYCTLNGDPVVVLEDDTGEMYVSYKDVKKAGFALFRRDTYDTLLVDKKQLTKEFELHLLAEAKSFLLKKQLKCSEEEILSTIARCRDKVLSDHMTSSQQETISSGSHIVDRLVNATGPGISVTSNLCNGFSYVQGNTIRERHPQGVNDTNRMDHRQKGGNDSANCKRRGRSTGQQQRDLKEQQSSNTYSVRNKQDGFRDNKRINNMPGSSNENVINEFIDKPNYNRDNRSLNKPGRRNESSINNSIDRNNKSQNKPRRSNESRINDFIDTIKLTPGNCYNVKVCFVEGADVQWVQREEDVDPILEMTLEIQKIASNIPDIENPKFGQLILGCYEDVWYRAKVISQEPLSVQYIDYGNRNAPEAVKVLPDSFKKMPAVAVKITGLQKFNIAITDGQALKIMIKQQCDDGTYIVNLEESEGRHSRLSERTTAEEKREITVKSEDRRPISGATEEIVYMNNLKPYCDLKDEDVVRIIGVREKTLLVKSKACVDKCKELGEYIKSLDKSQLVLSAVKNNQLVLCSMEGALGLYRATVVSKENSTVNVRYVDYHGEDTLSMKSLRNVDEHLADHPKLMIEIPFFLESADSQAEKYVEHLIKSKEKLEVVLQKDRVDLKLQDGTLLSKKISTFNNVHTRPPLSLVPVEQVKAKASSSGTSQEAETVEQNPELKPVPEKVKFTMMDRMRLNKGEHNVFCCSINSLTDITVASLEEKAVDDFQDMSCIDVKDNEPYEPEKDEMCLIAYKGDEDTEANWYRGVVTRVEGSKYTATCVDYGNEVIICKNEIRKFPLDMKNIPMLGISCECVGIPNNDKVLKKFKEMELENKEIKIKVLEYIEEETKYKVELPEIYQQLKQNKVI